MTTRTPRLLRLRLPYVLAALSGLVLASGAAAQWTRARGPWRRDAVFIEITRRLSSVMAIDVHTHLLGPAAFDPKLDLFQPPGLRSSNPAYRRALETRFGVAANLPLEQAIQRAQVGRRGLITRLGENGYWNDHLDTTLTEIAFVNQSFRDGTDGKRLRWVPHATDLLYPLPLAGFRRDAETEKDLADIQAAMKRHLSEAGLGAVPEDLDGYATFVEGALARWKTQGAAAVKLWDAYLRTLRFQDVPAERARALYARGLRSPLSRDEYLAVQDHLAWRVFLKAGALDLPVHIHSSYGAGSTLRLQEADVRNLENLFTDPRLEKTRFLLIHGGGPLFHEAAYLAASKANVWIDVSALPFLYPVPDLAAALRTYVVMAPEKVLFGTDASGSPGIPLGAEVQHLVLAPHLREALALCLMNLVRDEFTDLDGAVRIGRGVLRDNAARLHGLEARR